MNVPFKTRVKNTAIEYAKTYNSFFVNKSYLIISEAFSNQPYYIIEAEASNYLHLLGVNTKLSAKPFFQKCLDGSLQENDFEILYSNRPEKDSKGTIRRKITALTGLSNVISSSSTVEEDFSKNRIVCSFAAANKTCTMGFTTNTPVKPKTLLNGNLLSSGKSKPILIALSKLRTDEKYNKVMIGSIELLASYSDCVKELLSQELIDEIEKKNADCTKDNRDPTDTLL